MATVQLKYSTEKRQCGDSNYACLFVGKTTDIAQAAYASVEKKLSPLVKEDVFNEAVHHLGSAKKGAMPLYLQSRTLAVLPSNGSRHNCPFSPHALTQAVKSNLPGYQDECVYIICERKAVFALGCAVARAFGLYSRKTNTKTDTRTVTVEFHLVGEDQTVLSQNDIDCLTSAAESIRLSARIVDAPCNEMNTDHFLEEIRTVGKYLGIKPFILQGTELDERGFGGLYGVGKAAIHQPALAVLSHKPAGATETIAWVGKGIVYDTGGLSIKGKTAMPGMKRDCGGAAGLLGAFRTAVKLGFKQNLHAVFCLAENAVGPIATRPDDVHVLYSGLTVEINNTDAEGRLVLGDGVAYAKKDLGANVIVDMATLTGAQGISTGLYHAGLLTNNASWEESCVYAGQRSGDLVHPLPYCPELHFSEFASAIADMKNSVKDRGNAQSSCAGLFIESHLGRDYKGVWVHVDMAAPAQHGERATGYGVALMLSLFRDQSQCALLQQ